MWIVWNFENDFGSHEWFYSLLKILIFFDVDVAFLFFWELWDEAIVSNEARSFNWYLWLLCWFLNDLLDLLDSLDHRCCCWLLSHFTSHGWTNRGTCGWNIFLLMNYLFILFFLSNDDLFVLNFDQHQPKIGQLLSLLVLLMILEHYLSCLGAHINRCSWWDISRINLRYTRRTEIGKCVLILNLNSHGFFKGRGLSVMLKRVKAQDISDLSWLVDEAYLWNLFLHFSSLVCFGFGLVIFKLIIIPQYSFSLNICNLWPILSIFNLKLALLIKYTQVQIRIFILSYYN